MRLTFDAATIDNIFPLRENPISMVIRRLMIISADQLIVVLSHSLFGRMMNTTRQRILGRSKELLFNIHFSGEKS